MSEGSGILTPKNPPGHHSMLAVSLRSFKSTRRKVFYLFIIASHIGTARARIGYTTSVREYTFRERWSL